MIETECIRMECEFTDPVCLGNRSGLSDLPQSGNLDMSLTWRFLKEKANLTVGCYDVLETQGISPYMNYGKQVVYNHYPSYREFKLTFSYRFGAYKDKERKEVDTSRFR